MFFVYILKSLKDQRYYIGQTNNLDRRLKEHNKGRVKATRHRVPLILIYKEEFTNRKEATEREKFFKTHRGYNFLKKQGLY